MRFGCMILDAEIGEDMDKAGRNSSFRSIEGSHTNDQIISL
jgi:hypothetical protein